MYLKCFKYFRQKYNISSDDKIPTKGILKNHHDLQKKLADITLEAKETENKLVSVELDNRNLRSKLSKLIKTLNNLGYNKDKIKDIYESSDSEIFTPRESNST